MKLFEILQKDSRKEFFKVCVATDLIHSNHGLYLDSTMTFASIRTLP